MNKKYEKINLYSKTNHFLKVLPKISLTNNSLKYNNLRQKYFKTTNFIYLNYTNFILLSCDFLRFCCFLDFFLSLIYFINLLCSSFVIHNINYITFQTQKLITCLTIYNNYLEFKML